MTDPQPDAPSAGPYGTAALAYHRAGWSPLPLPPHAKTPVPAGWTGAKGATPSGADVYEWTERHPDGNLALRLPPHILGVDVDNYDAKPGGLVLGQLEATLGALPATWRTTSRDDGHSGIRLYRIPEGLRWPGGMGPGIDTIRFDHRYALAWPSTHPNGGTYRWIRPDGTPSVGDIPHPDDLPDLPDAWVQHFTGGELSSEQPHAGLEGSAAVEWIGARGAGVACRHMERALQRGLDDMASTHSGGRHDAALRLTNRLAWLAGEGHLGGTYALLEACRVFLLVVGSDRRPGDAEAEWDRMLTGAVDIAAAAHPTPSADPCADPFHGLLPPTTNRQDAPWQTSAPTPSTTPTVSTSTPTDAPAPATAGHAIEATPTPPAPFTASPSGPETAPSSSPTPTVASPSSPTPSPDDATELTIRRHQAAAQEAERIRAQRAAARLLDREDRDAQLEDRVWRKLLDDDAAAEYRRRTEPPAPPFDAGTLADILARPPEPAMRADGLIPWEASVLLVAQRKTGKTTCLLNYARALITGEPFLGEFDMIPLQPEQRVAFLNYEVSAHQLARWADEVGVDPDRLYLVNLRGRRNPLARPDDRAQLAAELRAQNVAAVIVDPFGRAYSGASQNDAAEVGAFLTDLDMFVRAEVGATDVLLAAHAGWDGERSRGSTALEDWPDTIITLTRDDDDEAKRYMRAMGRDVDVDEDQLVMTTGRTLVRAGTGSRKNAKDTRKATSLAVFVRRAASQSPGASTAQLVTLIRAMDDAPSFQDREVSKAARQAADAGFITITDLGSGKAKLHYPATPSNPVQTPSMDAHPNPVHPVYMDGVGGGQGGRGGATATSDGVGVRGRTSPVAGGKYAYDHTTGETIDPTTGEVVTRGAGA